MDKQQTHVADISEQLGSELNTFMRSQAFFSEPLSRAFQPLSAAGHGHEYSLTQYAYWDVEYDWARFNVFMQEETLARAPMWPPTCSVWLHFLAWLRGRVSSFKRFICCMNNIFGHA